MKGGVGFKTEISIYHGMVSKILATLSTLLGSSYVPGLSSLLRASYVPGTVLDVGDKKIINKTKFLS